LSEKEGLEREGKGVQERTKETAGVHKQLRYHETGSGIKKLRKQES
jgi:hypothetical protein